MEKEYLGSEIYHHGIPGQKWGKKNGPPYPLDKSNYSASERRATKNPLTGTFKLDYHEERRIRNQFKADRVDEKAQKLRTKNEADFYKKKIYNKSPEAQRKWEEKNAKKQLNLLEDRNKYIERSRKHRERIDEIIRDLSKEGFTMESVTGKRAVNYGKQAVMLALTGIATLPIMFTFGGTVGGITMFTADSYVLSLMARSEGVKSKQYYVKRY